MHLKKINVYYILTMLLTVLFLVFYLYSLYTYSFAEKGSISNRCFYFVLVKSTYYVLRFFFYFVFVIMERFSAFKLHPVFFYDHQYKVVVKI